MTRRLAAANNTRHDHLSPTSVTRTSQYLASQAMTQSIDRTKEVA